jgi:hypothetical protein
LSKLNGKDKVKDKDKEKEEEKARSEVDTFNDDDLPLPPPYAADKKKHKELIKDHDKESLSEIPSEKRDLDASVLTMDSLRHPFLSPPSPTSPHSPPDEVLDVRRKETIAAVAQMKNKLRNMGVLGVTGEIGRKLEFRDRNRAGSATATPSSPSKPDAHAAKDDADYFHNGGEAGSHPLPVPDPLRSPASPGAQSKRAKSPSTLSEEVVPPPPPRTSHIKQTKSRSRSGSPKQKIPSPTQNRFLEVDVDDEDYGSVQGTIAFELAPVVGSPSSRKTVMVASAFSNDANDEKEQEQEQGQGHVLLKPIPHPSNLTKSKSLHHNDDKNGVEVSSPRLPSAPTSPSKDRGRGGAERVMSDDTSSVEQREDPLTDLYKQKEEKLRLKAAQCKQIIR